MDVKSTARKWKLQLAQACGFRKQRLLQPTRGLVMIVAAVSACSEVTVYGFDADSFPYHYFSIAEAQAWYENDPELLSTWSHDRLLYPCLTKHGITLEHLDKMVHENRRFIKDSHDWNVETLLLTHLDAIGRINWVRASSPVDIDERVLRTHRKELACAPDSIRQRARELGIHVPEHIIPDELWDRYAKPLQQTLSHFEDVAASRTCNVSSSTVRYK
mmetsp:Transcript_3599/g.12914  ORF Transcript_3599/g.12914 Transcript_3599/m.12914 type:complete len:217 (+) Transcript_3599:221-871(+)